MARSSILVGLILLGYAAVLAQDVRPSFDAASVRPAAPPVGPFWPGSRPVCPVTGCGGPGTGSPERITFTHVSLKNLIRAAYDVRSPHHIEAPAWMGSATFDVVATFPPGTTRDQANLMLQNLLADRFQVKLHRSTRELPVYALVIAKNGARSKASVDDPNASPAAAKGRGTIWTTGAGGPRKRFEFDGFTMAQFADVLAHEVDRPVIDMTGLTAKYDVRLEFAPQLKCCRPARPIRRAP